jgi:tripartite-type tricarboxylate transporter receptor subunit TctC
MDHGPWTRRVPAVAGQNVKLHGCGRVAAVLAAALALATSAALSVVAAPADYPSRTIRIITPLAAGSASDIVLRILAEKLSDQFKRPVIVQNQPGAGSVVADHTIVNAPADGYTIGWIGNNNAISVSLFKDAVDPRAEMRPIVGVSEFAYLLVTNAASPYKSIKQWIDTARAKPDTLTIGTSTAGTSNHLAALLFKASEKLAITVVPYRGPSELSVALLRNDIDLVVNAYGGLRPQIEAGQIRPLAVTSANRLPELPDVPTMTEAGVADYIVTSWNSLYGPKAMPDQAVETLNRAATEVLGDPAVKARFKEAGFDAAALPADLLDARMRSETERWARVIAEAGIEKQ